MSALTMTQADVAFWLVVSMAAVLVVGTVMVLQERARDRKKAARAAAEWAYRSARMDVGIASQDSRGKSVNR